MNKNLYEMIFWDRLKELIDKDPKRAKRLMTDCPECCPGLYEIGILGNPKDYPSMILATDTVQGLLDGIDWSAGRRINLSPNELPRLDEILEALPL